MALDCDATVWSRKPLLKRFNNIRWETESVPSGEWGEWSTSTQRLNETKQNWRGVRRGSPKQGPFPQLSREVTWDDLPWNPASTCPETMDFVEPEPSVACRGAHIHCPCCVNFSCRIAFKNVWVLGRETKQVAPGPARHPRTVNNTYLNRPEASMSTAGRSATEADTAAAVIGGLSRFQIPTLVCSLTGRVSPRRRMAADRGQPFHVHVEHW
jgi:hypothetical protein